MHPRCNKQHEMSMHMMLCSGFSASNTRGVIGAAKCGEKGGGWRPRKGKRGATTRVVLWENRNDASDDF
jgi:hypothetical protein